MRIGLSPSIANRIFAITAILLALMAVVAAINAVMSTRVGSLISTVGETYLPAYGMLARTHIRALEQSLTLRQAAIADLEAPVDEARIASLLAAADSFGPEADAEIATARDLIKTHEANGVEFGDDLLLGRLDAQLEAIAKSREDYNALVHNFEATLRKSDLSHLETDLQRIDAEREKINESLEDTRKETLELAEECHRHHPHQSATGDRTHHCHPGDRCDHRLAARGAAGTAIGRSR